MNFNLYLIFETDRQNWGGDILATNKESRRRDKRAWGKHFSTNISPAQAG